MKVGHARDHVAIWRKQVIKVAQDFIQAALTIRRIAVQETGVSRPHGGLIQEPHEHHGTMVLMNLRFTLNWSPIMPRDASVSDSRCNVLQSGVIYTRDFTPSPHADTLIIGNLAQKTAQPGHEHAYVLLDMGKNACE